MDSIITFYLQVLAILIVATLLAYWCGWGFARLALPEALMPYRHALTPLLGFALLVTAGYWAVWTIAGLNVALPVILAATLALNLLAWRRHGPPRFPRPDLPLLIVLLITLLVGLAPLLHYGHPAVIGGGWDVESALPTARYLERGPVASIAQAPANPLRDLVRDPPRIGKTLGFAIWQGSIDLLTGIEALITFTPLLAWLRTLGILAIYVLLRTTFGLSRWPALLGATLSSASALMLWTAFFNFEKQMAGWPLIPLGLTVGLAAVDSLVARSWRAWPAALAAAVSLTAQAIAYYPALTLWVPLAGALGLVWVVESGTSGGRFDLRAAARPILAAGALLALTLLLAAPAIIDYLHGFSYRYGNQVTTLGVFRYIMPTEIVGLTPFDPELRENPPVSPAALVGGLALLGLMLAGISLPASKPESAQLQVAGRMLRLRWIAMLIGTLVYLAWLRWGQAYPYAYMKGATYAGFVFLGLAAAGWYAIHTRLPRPARPVALIAPMLLLAALGLAQWRVVADHWQQPGLYPNELPALLELRQRIPAGSTVTYTSDPRLNGPISGLAAYALDHTVVWGAVRTGYYNSSSGASDAIGEYGLLLASEDPAPWGYQDQIWRGGSYALYRRTPTTLAHLRLGYTLAPGQSAPFRIGADRLANAPSDLPAGPDRLITLAVAALEPGRLRAGQQTIAIPAGGALLQLARQATPATLEFANTGTTPITLRYLTLSEQNGQETGITPVPALVVAQGSATANGTTVTTTIKAMLNDSGPLVLSLDIWDTPRGVQYGWYGVELNPAPVSQGITLTLDLASGVMNGMRIDGSKIPLGASFVGLQKGDYVARLQIGAGPLVLAAPAELFAFRIDDRGVISDVRASTAPLIATTVDRPDTPLNILIGEDTRIIGYAAKTRVRPAETLNCVIWWRAERDIGDTRSVLVHLLNERGERILQGDGPPANGALPTEQWRAGNTILDSRKLELPADLPPGTYTLAIGMYRWPSLERLPATADTIRLPEDMLRIPIVVTR